MANEPGLQASPRQLLPYVLSVLALCGLYASSRFSYILFHSLVEVLGAVILLTIFVLAWNTRKILENHYLLFVGISFFAAGTFELVHMFAYKGFGVFPSKDANLPTQLWIVSRFLFALPLLIAPLFISRRLDATVALTAFAGLTTVLMVAVFTEVFPDCFLEGQGLTPFKIYSEYLIILIFLAALGLLVRNRDHFDPLVLRMLALAIVSGAAADLAFTQYVSIYDQANLIGHFLLLFSALLIYRAFVVTAVKDPMTLLCRNLEQSEARLRLIAQTSMDLIFQLDLTGKVVFCSPAVAQYGYNEAAVIGQEFGVYIAPEDRDRAKAAFTQAIGGQEIQALQLSLRRADDSLFDAEINLGPLTVNGTIFGIQGISRDMTARKQGEKALKANEERLQMVLKASSTGIFEINLQTGEGWWNEVEYQLLGLRPGEVVSSPENFFRYVHGDDVSTLQAAWQQALQTGELNTEFRIVTADGQERWLAGKGQFLAEGKVSGQAPRFLGVNFDITDRKVAEEKMRQSEALYRGIGESIDYGVWVCTPDGRNTYASESFLRMVGLSQAQCSDFGWGEVLHPDDAERTLAAWRECVRTGGNWDIEHRFRGIDGQWHQVLARGVPVRNTQGEITCWAGINLDISRLKEAEEQIKASLAEKEVMLREIHHRVKNNLQVISSLISLQTDTVDDERMQRVFGDVRDRVRAIALVHEKLYQTGNLARLNFADYAANLLQYLWRCHGALAERARLRLAIAPLTLPIETAVPCGLILNELAGNALKHAFSDGRDGEVTVALDQDLDTRTYCLRVADNGLGLPPGLDWRESHSLGLRLVQILAGQLGGTVTAHSKDGVEFQVRFSLPGDQP